MYGKEKEISDRMRVVLHNAAQPLQTIVSIADLLEMRASENSIKSEELKDMANLLSGAGLNIRKQFNDAREYLHGKEKEARIRSVYSREEFLNYLKGHIVPMARKMNILYRVGRFDLPEKQISIDESFMYNLTLNIITNAKEAEARRMANDYWTDDKYLFMAFTDDGHGMPKSVLEKCTTGHTTKKHGSGIGLKFIREEAEKNRGFLLVESEPGRGAKITFAQPLSLYYDKLLGEK